jgi:hypothetical protein
VLANQASTRADPWSTRQASSDACVRQRRTPVRPGWTHSPGQSGGSTRRLLVRLCTFSPGHSADLLMSSYCRLAHVAFLPHDLTSHVPGLCLKCRTDRMTCESTQSARHAKSRSQSGADRGASRPWSAMHCRVSRHDECYRPSVRIAIHHAVLGGIERPRV